MKRNAINKSDELFKNIGIMSSEFAFLESELINAVGLLIDDNYLTVGHIITDSLTFSRTVDIFQKLGKFRLK